MITITITLELAILLFGIGVLFCIARLRSQKVEDNEEELGQESAIGFRLEAREDEE